MRSTDNSACWRQGTASTFDSVLDWPSTTVSDSGLTELDTESYCALQFALHVAAAPDLPLRLRASTLLSLMLQTSRLPVDRLFRAFSDRTRLRILHLLLDGELCVCDLVAILRVPQPTASRHLAYLRRAGLVHARKEQSWSYYSLAEARNSFHARLLDCLRTCFTEVPEFARDNTRRLKATGDRCCKD